MNQRCICLETSTCQTKCSRNSAHPEIRPIWSDTSWKTYVRTRRCARAKKPLQTSLISKAEFHVHSRKLQGHSGNSVKVITKCISRSGIGQWSRIVEALTDFWFLVPFCEEGTPAAASNSFKLGEMEENCQPKLHAVWKYIPQQINTYYSNIVRLFSIVIFNKIRRD